MVALRQQYPYWGPRKIRYLLQDQAILGRLPSPSTVARILNRRGLISPREAEPDWPAVGRFERPCPNDLWQMDLKGAIRLPDGHKIYPVGILDDHSRYLLGLWMIPDVRDRTVISCWIKAATGHGLPDTTLTDHGSQFRMEDEASSAFRVHLWACGVHHTQGRVKHPQTQGKIERFWRTLKEEVLSRCHYRDISSWQRCFDDWREVYNRIRPHQELGDEPPIRRYRISERPYVEPDRHAWSGMANSYPRRVSPRGQVSINGQRVAIGWGYAGWTVEARPLGNGCWHVFFRDRLVRELVLSTPLER